MRSLKLERKPRDNPRARSVRKPVRASREAAPVQGASAGATAFTKTSCRALSDLWRIAVFRRPILLMMPTLGTVIFAVLAALFASGVIGRGIHGVGRIADVTIADAGFGISEIHLSGNSRVPPETILAALGMKPGESIFAANLGDARARIMALDWIASADVVRRYPDAIFVSVVEKRPFALWQSQAVNNGKGGVAVVERAGGVITTQGIEKFTRLPKLVGDGAPAAAADLVDAVMAHRAASGPCRGL